MSNTPLQYPLINGNRYDFSSIELVVRGRRLVGFKSISYKDSLKPGEVHGASAQIIGRTRGQRTMSASLEVYRQEADELIDALGPGFMEVRFGVVVTYADYGQPVVIDRIIGCRITDLDKSASSGADALAVKFDLHPMDMLHNGLSPVSRPRSSDL